MPIYRIRPLANPYVPINVGFYDKKALEKQQRQDAARQAWSKSIADTSSQQYYDEDARKKYLETQNKLFEDVIQKNSGNLSAGLPDFMTALDKANTNPYHNLNKTQMQNIILQRQMQEKYGANYIDQSKGLYEPLYENGQWRNPSTIKAQGMQANNYQKILEDQMHNLAPVITQYTGPLTKAPGQAGYLQSINTAISKLSPEMLQKLANDPQIYQAFLANAPTALQDTRQYGNAGGTYKDMFGTQEGFANFFMGNLKDKVRNDTKSTTTYRDDKAYWANVAAANAKKLEKYKKNLQHEGNVIPNQEKATTGISKYEKLTYDLKNLSVKDNTYKMITDDFISRYKLPVPDNTYDGFIRDEKELKNMDHFDYLQKVYETYITKDGKLDRNRIQSMITDGQITPKIGERIFSMDASKVKVLNETYQRVAQIHFDKNAADKHINNVNAKIIQNGLDDGSLDKDKIETLVNKYNAYNTDGTINMKLLKERVTEGIHALSNNSIHDFTFGKGNLYSQDEITQATNNIKLANEIGDQYYKLDDYINNKQKEIIDQEKQDVYTSISYIPENKKSAYNAINRALDANEQDKLTVVKSNFTYPLDKNNKGIIANIADYNDLDINDVTEILTNSDTKLSSYFLNDGGVTEYNPAILNITYKTNKNGEFATDGKYSDTIKLPNVQFGNKKTNLSMLNDIAHEVSTSSELNEEDTDNQDRLNDTDIKTGKGVFSDNYDMKIKAVQSGQLLDIPVRYGNGNVQVYVKGNESGTYNITTTILNAKGDFVPGLQRTDIPKENYLQQVYLILGRLHRYNYNSNPLNFSIAPGNKKVQF